MPPNFPFTAVIGQLQMKLALLLCAIDPAIGGVLLSGGRGSAKSTLVRSLSVLLPDRTLATIPLGATEEMVTGSIQLEQALKDGSVEFNPGILARAHQGLLYVDEVNLLPDHLVDLLLDVSASKINLIERDGLSHEHAADFVLVGTMNPDEGELRPQLLDRFGLMAAVQSRFDLVERQQIVEQRLAFDSNPDEVIAKHADAMQQLSEQIHHAMEKLSSITMPESVKTEIAELCNNAGVEGLRADITLYRAATAHAALQGAAEVRSADLDAVSELVLAHRRNTEAPAESTPPNNGQESGNNPQNTSSSSQSGGSSIAGSWGAMAPQPVSSADPVPLDGVQPAHVAINNHLSDTRSASRTVGGHTTQRSIAGKVSVGKLDWFRTLIAAENRSAPRDGSRIQQVYRKRPVRRAIELDMIVLDTSASTLSGGGLRHAKGMIRALSAEAYLARRKLALVTFGNSEVRTILNPQKAPKNIEPILQKISGGGGTPLRQALLMVQSLIQKTRPQGLSCALYLLTDGRVEKDTSLPADLSQISEVILVDIESSKIKLALGKQLAQKLNARYIDASQRLPS